MELKLEKMEQVALSELGIVFNSNGDVLTKKEIKPFIRRIILNKLNFSIWYSQDKNIECNDLIEIKNLLMSKN